MLKFSNCCAEDKGFDLGVERKPFNCWREFIIRLGAGVSFV